MIFDPLRKKTLHVTPEERVRQALLQGLVADYGFPQELIAIEKDIRTLPGVRGAPNRRIDLLCYGNWAGELQPLLLIECKAVPLSQEVVEQVIGYNVHVSAPFVALVNGDEALLGECAAGNYQFQPGILPYEVLLETAKHRSA